MTAFTKPNRAINYVESKVRFPIGVMPKIDGVRAINANGKLTARTLKPLKNRYTTEFYSKPEYNGIDGELAANDEKHPDLCRLTSSAVNTKEGEPFTLWHAFDFIRKDVIHLPYKERWDALEQHLRLQWDAGLCGTVRLVPLYIVDNVERLRALHAENVEKGYEGTILRSLSGHHKNGKSTVNEGLYLRIKDFEDAEALVVGIIEGEENLNEAQTNELGHTFRTSHKANKVPNGMVGALQCKKVPTGEDIVVSAGAMPHDLRRHYFLHPEEIVNQYITYKSFTHGVKDKPRFPTFKSVRSPEDM